MRARNRLLPAMGLALFACGQSFTADAVVDGASHDGGASGERGEAGSHDAGESSGDTDASTAKDSGAEGASMPSCPEWTGDAQWGTALDDEVLAALALPDGIVVAGFQGGQLGVVDDGPVGNGSGWVRKLSPVGTRSWDAAFDSADMDTVEALAWDPVGARLFVVGRTLGSLGGPNQGQWDAYVADLDQESGARGLLIQLGDERPQHPASASFAAGRLLVGGYDDVYIEGNAVLDDENPFEAAIDTSSASLLWWTRDRTPGGDLALAVLARSDGSSFLGGTRPGGRPPSSGAWLRDVATSGASLAEANVSPFFLDSVTAVLAAPDGLLRVVGTRIDGSTSQPFVAAWDPASEGTVWLRTFDPPVAGASYVAAAAMFPDGGVALAGSTQGSFDAAHAPAGGLDAFALHVDADGTLAGAWQAGSAQDDAAQAVAVDACGRVLVGGVTKGALLAPVAGGEDVFVAMTRLR